MDLKILYLLPCHLSEEPRPGMLSSFQIDVLKELKYFFCEEVRTARRFISSLKLGITIESLHFFLLDKDTERAAIKNFLKQIPTEVTEIGLMSEAGCPGVADPGAQLVMMAHELGWKVVPIPGPSSIILSLMGSGFNGQQFHFHGYLPIKQEERIKVLRKLEEDTAHRGTTHIFIETPFRNMSLLSDMLKVLKPETLLCIAANLTSSEEIIQTKKISFWKNNIPNLHKIPTIFLIGKL